LKKKSKPISKNKMTKAFVLILLLSVIAACSATSFLRFFQGSPNTPAVDIYVDGTRVVSNLSYRQFTQVYLPLAAGSHNVKVWPSGATSGQGNPTINSDVSVSDTVFYTVYIAGTLAGTGNQAIQAVTYVDEPGVANVTRIRAIQLSPDAVPVNMVLQANASALLIGNITYLQPNPIYVALPPGVYALDFRPADNNSIIAVSAPNSTYNVNTSYSVVLIGLAGATPALDTVIIADAIRPATATTAPAATTTVPAGTTTVPSGTTQAPTTVPSSSTTFPASPAAATSVVLGAILAIAIFLVMF